MASKGAEYKAGTVILLGLIVLGLGLFLVSGGAEQFKDKKKYVVLFKNGGGIGSGAAVYLAGRRVGYVTSVGETTETVKGSKGTYVAVEIEVFADSRVHVDSDCYVSKTVTGIVSLNMEYGASNKVAPPGEKLAGRKQASFEDAIDSGEKLIRKGATMVEKINGVLDAVREDAEALDVAELRKRVGDLVETLNATAGNIDKIVQSAGGDVDEILKSAKKGAGSFESVADQVNADWQRLSKNLQATVKQAQDAMAELKAILKDNRPDIRIIVQNFADASRRVAPVLLKVETLLKSLDGTVLDIRPKLVSGLKSAAKAMKNFQAVTEDLRTAPWKLINKPSDDEVAEIHLYNAARNFVRSAEEIQTVVAELDALRKKDVLNEQMKERIQELTAQLDLSLKNYQTREKELVKLIAKARNGNTGK